MPPALLKAGYDLQQEFAGPYTGADLFRVVYPIMQGCDDNVVPLHFARFIGQWRDRRPVDRAVWYMEFFVTEPAYRYRSP